MTTTTRTPYDAEHVAIVDNGSTITALYIPNPEDAKRPAYVLDHILDRSRFEYVEVVADATRFYKREGATFSGWIVRTGIYYSDPIANKRDAMKELRRTITEYFQR